MPALGFLVLTPNTRWTWEMNETADAVRIETCWPAGTKTRAIILLLAQPDLRVVGAFWSRSV